jgi:tight adherence protein B
LSKETVTIVLFSIILLCLLGLSFVFIRLAYLNSQRRLKRRLDKFVDVPTESEQQSSQGLSTRSTILSSSLEGAREKISGTLAFLSTDALRKKIASAYWPISDVEFIFIRIAATLAGLLLGWLISSNIIGGLGLGFLVYLIPGFVLDRSIVKRRKKFQDKLVDFLVLVKGAILAGSSLPQALDLAVKEVPAPISEEFGQVLRETNLGLTLEEALNNLTARMQGDDLQIIVTAIIINNQLGGNLSTLLEATIETIRDRIQLFSEVRSLTAYTRIVSYIISLLPLFLAVIIFLLSPGYFDSVKTSLLAQIILLLGLIGIIIGNITMRLIMRIRI